MPVLLSETRFLLAIRSVQVGVVIELARAMHAGRPSRRGGCPSDSVAGVRNSQRPRTSSPKEVGCHSMVDALSPTMTLRDFVRQYIALNKVERFEKVPHGRYINFVAEFLAADKG
jgi:hypothetical protein